MWAILADFFVGLAAAERKHREDHGESAGPVLGRARLWRAAVFIGNLIIAITIPALAMLTGMWLLHFGPFK